MNDSDLLKRACRYVAAEWQGRPVYVERRINLPTWIVRYPGNVFVTRDLGIVTERQLQPKNPFDSDLTAMETVDHAFKVARDFQAAKDKETLVFVAEALSGIGVKADLRFDLKDKADKRYPEALRCIRAKIVEGKACQDGQFYSFGYPVVFEGA